MDGGKGIYVGGTLLPIVVSPIFVGLWVPTIPNLGRILLEDDWTLQGPAWRLRGARLSLRSHTGPISLPGLAGASRTPHLWLKPEKILAGLLRLLVDTGHVVFDGVGADA